MPSSSVSPDHTTAESDFWLYIVYVLSTFVLYVTCLTTLFFLVSKSEEGEESGIKSFTKDNPEVLKATIIVIGSFVVVEILAELIMAIIWTANAKNHYIGVTVFIAAFAYYGPGIFSVYKVTKKCYLYYHEKGSHDRKHNTADIEEVKIDTLFTCFVWIDNDANNHGKKRDEKGTDEENQDGVNAQDKKDSEVQPAEVVPDNKKEQDTNLKV